MFLNLFKRATASCVTSKTVAKSPIPKSRKPRRKRNSNNTSGYDHICWDKQKKKWRVAIVKMHVGLFKTLQEAVLACNRKMREIYGYDAPQQVYIGKNISASAIHARWLALNF
jgi:hypothetical protein